MKKICLLILCFGLVACDNGIVGKCLPNNSTISTTEQDGKVIGTKTTVRYICGCFENKESDLPDFGPSNEEFSFETTDTKTVNDVERVDGANKVCDKQCTKWCRENKK